MIKTWHEGNSEADKERLFNKINAGLKDLLNKNLKEALPNKGAKDIATTLMSRKVGKNLYISPSGRKYRRVPLNGKEASKNSSRH
jgi:hypothetical protein